MHEEKIYKKKTFAYNYKSSLTRGFSNKMREMWSRDITTFHVFEIKAQESRLQIDGLQWILELYTENRRQCNTFYIQPKQQQNLKQTNEEIANIKIEMRKI